MTPRPRYRNAMPGRTVVAPPAVEEVSLTGRRQWPMETKTVRLRAADGPTEASLSASGSVPTAFTAAFTAALADSSGGPAFVQQWRRTIQSPTTWPSFDGLPRRADDDLERRLLDVAGGELAMRWQQSSNAHLRRVSAEWLTANMSVVWVRLSDTAKRRVAELFREKADRLEAELAGRT